MPKKNVFHKERRSHLCLKSASILSS